MRKIITLLKIIKDRRKRSATSSTLVFFRWRSKWWRISDASI